MENAIKTEFFSIDKNKMPELFIYKIDFTSANINQLGGKLKYKLSKIFNNHIFGWNSDKALLVSDLNIPDIHDLLTKLWSDGCQSVKNIIQVRDNIDGMSVAEYAVSYIKSKYRAELNRLEQNYKLNNSTDNFCVNLIIDFRAWVFDSESYISISIHNKIVYTKDLLYYYQNESKKIEDMQVVVIKAFSGYDSTATIKSVYGKLKDEGERLYKATNTENLKKLIQKKYQRTSRCSNCTHKI